MKSVSENEVRRARPLLGTFVEITAGGENGADLHKAIDQAFEAIIKVHRLMSFHDPASDISRLNAHAASCAIRIHPWTSRVLRAAKNFSKESNGAFDITVASLLRNWGLLPNAPLGAADTSPPTKKYIGRWADIIFENNQSVRFRRPLIIDLGGIAKGFAVDRAVESLVKSGIRSGLVNAGGDLRAFGPEPRLIHVRHPLDPTRTGRALFLRGDALATSVPYYIEQIGVRGASFVDGRTRQPVSEHVSVSVSAPDCMTADALTKIVMVMRDQARPILDRHKAETFILQGEKPTCRFLHGHRAQ
ncbi:MAG TPA: FAD:protein FMN transferase, partial [Chthoniobacterales bacterium]